VWQNHRKYTQSYDKQFGKYYDGKRDRYTTLLTYLIDVESGWVCQLGFGGNYKTSDPTPVCFGWKQSATRLALKLHGIRGGAVNS